MTKIKDEVAEIELAVSDSVQKVTEAQPFIFLNPSGKETFGVGSEVAIYWKGGPDLPQKVNISLFDIQLRKVIDIVVVNHVEHIDPGLYPWIIPKTVPLLQDHSYQFYIQDVSRTAWTYSPVFKIILE
jgi:hypothetical protein